MLLLPDPVVAAVPVSECCEELLDLREHSDLMVDTRKQDEAGAWSRLRVGVFDRLLVAQEALPDGLRLLVIEGHRPVALQRHYFESYRSELQHTHSHWPVLSTTRRSGGTGPTATGAGPRPAGPQPRATPRCDRRCRAAGVSAWWSSRAPGAACRCGGRGRGGWPACDGRRALTGVSAAAAQVWAPARYLLGTTFQAVDLVAYAVGAMVGAAGDRAASAARRRPPRTTREVPPVTR